MSKTKELQVGNMKVTFPINAAERLYKELKKVIGNENLTRSSIVVVSMNLMTVVEHYDDVHGVQKKALILNALNHLIDDQINDPQEVMEMKLLVQLTLPTMLDTFISIDKKEMHIKLKKGCGKLLACCNQQ